MTGTLVRTCVTSLLPYLTWDRIVCRLLLPRLSTPEAPDEPPSVSEENVLKVECNITGNVNFMHSGITEVCQPVHPSTQNLIFGVGTQSDSC